MTASPSTSRSYRTRTALLAVVALVLLTVVRGAPAHAATGLPDSRAGRQMSWLLAASTRLPVPEAELRAHFAPEFLALPGYGPAEVNAFLATLGGENGLRLRRLLQAQPDTLVASVTGRAGRELALSILVNREALIEFAYLAPAAVGAGVALPAPTGPAPVGTDVVQLVDRTRGGRRLMLTRWYPAAPSARAQPRAPYASPLMTALLGFPRVRVNARTGAAARRGRLPVVLFSPGAGTSRLQYQALAEELASHGYLVISTDHTGEVPVELGGGHLALPALADASKPQDEVIADWSVTRVADLRLVLRRLGSMGHGPRPDRRRIAAMGHSLGGSTAAELMRSEPSVRAGIDLDGTIFGTARLRGVPRAFMVMTGKDGLDRSIREFFKHSRGPQLGLSVAGFEHGTFSDLPITAPEHPAAGDRPSARDIALQGAYVRAFLDLHLRNRPSRLLDGPSRRFPHVRFAYRNDSPSTGTHARTAGATPAADAVLGAFRHHRIVAFGLAHGLSAQEDFAIGLLRHPRFAATIDSIVVEFGNARYQALADRYVAGGDVSPEALRPVWRDTVGTAPDGVLDEAAARFFATVRRLNQTLPAQRRIRVALGDPAFDFRTLQRRHDLDQALRRHDRIFAAAAEREARGRRHVLLLSGFIHLARVGRELYGGDNALRILERRSPGRVWVIVPYWGGGARGQAGFERRYISQWPSPTLRRLTGRLGAEPADRILPAELPPGAHSHPGLSLRTIADALISFGPCSKLRTTTFSLAQYRDPDYRAELDRRSRILTGDPFVPPPTDLSNAPYCAVAAR
jgi:dienelactone hydrolase